MFLKKYKFNTIENKMSKQKTSECTTSQEVQLLLDIRSKVLSIMIGLKPLFKDLLEGNEKTLKRIYDAMIQSLKIDQNKAIQEFKTESLTITSSLREIQTTIDGFIKDFKISTDLIYENYDNYTYLSQVWMGDMYDGIDGIEAMNELFKELTNLKIDEGRILKSTILRLKKE